MVMGTRDRIFSAVNYAVLLLISAVIVFPLLYVISVSLTPYSEVLKNGGFIIIPKSMTLEAYASFMQDSAFFQAIGVTVFITVVGTLINLVLTTLLAYPLSKKELPARNVFVFMVAFTMLFNGGIIPTYLVVKSTGLMNSLWAMIIPTAIWSFNLLIVKTFFENQPDALEESAKIDGAGEWRVLLRIVIPLSMPVIATVGLFYTVGHWNEFFQAIMYVNDPDKRPLQVLLRSILESAMKPSMEMEDVLPSESLQMAAVILSAIPIIVVYPFVQKYFTQGMLLGSIKG